MKKVLRLVKNFSKYKNVLVELDQHDNYNTRCVHAGQEIGETGAVTVPIYQTSTFEIEMNPDPYDEDGNILLDELFDVREDRIYSRWRNPSRDSLERQIAALEGAEYCCVSSSGLGASNNIVSMLEAGDHLVSIDDVYGGTRELFSIMEKLGVEVDFVDLTDIDALLSVVNNGTDMIWIESPTNPTLKITDIRETVDIVKGINPDIICVVDNTFASPYFQEPFKLGADVILHSCTKYLSGHADVIMGAALTNDVELYDKIFFNSRTLGATAGPFDCFLCSRGIKTMGLRMKQHEQNAMAVAEYLEAHPKIARVLYPGLPSHPQHEIAKKQMLGFGGMISFYIDGGIEEAARFLENVEVFTMAVSLGGVESLCEHPASMTHMHVSEEDRAMLGILDGFVRLSVGIEDINDLIWDLEQALNKI